MKNDEQPPTAPAVGSSALLGDDLTCHRTESGNDRGRGASIPDEYPYRKTNLGGGADVSISLLQLLVVMSCPRVAEAEIQRLGKTDPQRQELRALVSLWQSLGCPTSVFWRECRVFCNRILDSYEFGVAQSPNSLSQPQD